MRSGLTFRAAFMLGWVTTVVLAPVASARDLYVAPAYGHDAHDGTWYVKMQAGVGPVATLQNAVMRALPGDRIIMLPTDQPLREKVVIDGRRTRGTESLPIVIEGNGNTFAGDRPLPWQAWDLLDGGVYRLRGPKHTSGVLFVDGQPAPLAPGDRWGATRPDLAPGSYALWQGQYYFRPAAGQHIEDNLLSISDADVGLYVYRTQHVVIRNLHFQGFTQQAVQVHGPVEGIRLESCRLASNGRTGLFADLNSKVALHSCFLEGNRERGVFADNYARVEADACLFANNGAATAGQGEGLVTVKDGEPTPLADLKPVLPAGLVALLADAKAAAANRGKPVEPTTAASGSAASPAATTSAPAASNPGASFFGNAPAASATPAPAGGFFDTPMTPAPADKPADSKPSGGFFDN